MRRTRDREGKGKSLHKGPPFPRGDYLLPGATPILLSPPSLLRLTVNGKQMRLISCYTKLAQSNGFIISVIIMTTSFISHLESREFFSWGAPPTYRVALLYFIGTAETSPKALRALPWLAALKEILTQILQTHALCCHCPRKVSLEQISLNRKGSPLRPP